MEWSKFWKAVESGPWVNIRQTTTAQEETIRRVAEEWGYESVAGLAGALSKWNLNYYDVIKASCRE